MTNKQQITEVVEQLDATLAGIDKTEEESASGWWKTSAGAKFGAKRKEEVRSFFTTTLTKLLEERDERLDNLLVTDFPMAWKVLVTKKDNHHEKCSWRVAGMLCDCAGQDTFLATIEYLRKSLALIKNTN